MKDESPGIAWVGESNLNIRRKSHVILVIIALSLSPLFLSHTHDARVRALGQTHTRSQIYWEIGNGRVIHCRFPVRMPKVTRFSLCLCACPSVRAQTVILDVAFASSSSPSPRQDLQCKKWQAAEIAHRQQQRNSCHRGYLHCTQLCFRYIGLVTMRDAQGSLVHPPHARMEHVAFLR